MAKGNNNETKYFGMTGGQLAVVVVLLGALISFAGYGPFASQADELKASSNGTQSVAGVSEANVQLNNEFVSVVCNTTNTIADVDTNYNDITNTASVQFDTNVSYAAGLTRFTMSTKNTAGTTVQLLNFTETGVLTEPVTDQTVPMIVNIDLSVLGGFSNSDQVDYSTVSAEANYLLDTAGVKFYPISTRSTDSTNPSVKIDTVLDSKSFSWLASTTTQSIDVTFDMSWTGVNKMDDISDKISVPVTIEGGDDSPIRIEIIRNDAIIV